VSVSAPERPSTDPAAAEPRADIRAILCHPADVRNVGASIRAVTNHGFDGVRIVTEADFDPEDLRAFSSESIDVADVTFHRTLTDAIADRTFVLGTSRRERHPDAPPQWPASGLRARLEGHRRVAILFGTERTGLTRAELDRCDAVVWIPTREAFASMNLGHAVACIGYELARPAPESVGPPVGAAEDEPRMSVRAREAFYDRVHAVCAEVGYPPGRAPEHLARRLRRFLGRANPTQEELMILAGVFSELLRLHRLTAGSGAVSEDPPPTTDASET
jgi:TrmH family RNA methyltransferase